MLLASSCAVSQPIVVVFPSEADWHFEYSDAMGVHLGFGKAQVGFYQDGGSFTINVTESAFGDTARLSGDLSAIGSEGQALPLQGSLPFRARGTWFTGERFVFEGAFDRQLSRILDCSVAYLDSHDCTIAAFARSLEEVRRQMATQSSPRRQKTCAAVRSLGEDYLEQVFTWQAHK